MLAITTISPPVMPSTINPFRSAVLFSTFYVSLATSIAIAAAIAVSGRGVSYESDFDVVGALKAAGGGGVAGAAAMVLQVLTLMPLRTIMNYQYRYGGSVKHAVSTLWNDGGFKRYYAGLGAAMYVSSPTKLIFTNFCAHFSRMKSILTRTCQLPSPALALWRHRRPRQDCVRLLVLRHLPHDSHAHRYTKDHAADSGGRGGSQAAPGEDQRKGNRDAVVRRVGYGCCDFCRKL